jgi:hypothetical protein
MATLHAAPGELIDIHPFEDCCPSDVDNPGQNRALGVLSPGTTGGQEAPSTSGGKRDLRFSA